MKAPPADENLSECCRCRVAGVTYSLRAANGTRSLLQPALSRLEPFFHNGAVDFHIEIVQVPTPARRTAVGRSSPTETAGDRGAASGAEPETAARMQISLAGADFAVRTPRSGRLQIFPPVRGSRESESKEAVHRGQIATATLNALAASMAYTLVPRRAVLVHAAGIAHREAGYLFMAASGGGKSTLSARSPEGSVLADDGVVIRRGRRGVRLYPTPFRQRPGGCIHRWSWRNRSVALTSIFMLEKGRSNRIEPCDRTRLLGRTLWEFTHFFGHLPPDRKVGAFDFWRRISQEYPIERLVLARDTVPCAWIPDRRTERKSP